MVQYFKNKFDNIEIYNKPNNSIFKSIEKEFNEDNIINNETDKITFGNKINNIKEPSEIFKYENNNLVLYGMQQVTDFVELYKLIKNLVEINKKNIYISFQPTLYEKQIFDKICTKCNCKFYEIFVEDYNAPTKENLYNLWKILDEHQYNNTEKASIIMHCTAGLGRTGTMVLSYIWLNLYRTNDTVTYIEMASGETVSGETVKEEMKKLNAIYNKDLEILNKYISSNISLPISSELLQYEKNIINILYSKIKQNSLIKNLMTEIKKYSIHSYEEIFNENDKQLLLLRRIYIISKLVEEYTRSPIMNEIILYNNYQDISSDIVVLDDNYYNFNFNKDNIDIDTSINSDLWTSNNKLLEIFKILDKKYDKTLNSQTTLKWSIDKESNKEIIYPILICYLLLKIIRKDYKIENCKNNKNILINFKENNNIQQISNLDQINIFKNLHDEIEKIDYLKTYYESTDNLTLINHILKNSIDPIYYYIELKNNIKYELKYRKYKIKYNNYKLKINSGKLN